MSNSRYSSIISHLLFYSLIFLCGTIPVGCQFIREKVLEEKPEWTNAELLGFWYQRELHPIFIEISKEESRLVNVSKWLLLLVLRDLKAREFYLKETTLIQANAMTAPNPKFHHADMNLKEEELKPEAFSQYRHEDTHRLSRTLFIEPGTEDSSPVIEFYVPRYAPSKWKWILSPYVETNPKDTNQTLLDYLVENLIKNIENIQGKIGIGIDW